MDKLGSDFQQKMKELQEDYRRKLPERLKSIQETWSICSQKDFSDPHYKQLEKLLHHLSGSGSTFGFPEISKKSKEIELLLSELSYENFVTHRKRIEALLPHLLKITLP